jgi:hypothetical protein
MKKKSDIKKIKDNPWNLRFIENQSEEICRLAIRQRPRVLQYVIHQTEEICLYAIKKDGSVIEFIKDQTVNICLAFLKHDSDGSAESYKYINIVPNPSHKETLRNLKAKKEVHTRMKKVFTHEV